MEKSNNEYKSYKALSRHESALLNTVEEFTVFSLATVRKLSGWKPATIANTLTSLKKKKIITPLKKNYYCVTDKIPENIFAIATTVTALSYLSFWTAASYYGFTEQQIKSIQVISTKQYPTIKIGEFKVETTTCQPQKFFGYHKPLDFPIAEREKLIVDILSKPELCGGMEEVRKCLKNAWVEIDQKALLSYIQKFKNKSCLARLGYVVETLKLKCTILPELKRYVPRGFVKLNPAKEKSSRYNQTWRIIIND